MKGASLLAWTEFKLNLRDPLMVFWSIAFPCLWLIIMTVIIGVPQTLTTYREKGILGRLRVTSVKTTTLVLGFSVSQVAFVVTRGKN